MIGGPAFTGIKTVDNQLEVRSLLLLHDHARRGFIPRAQRRPAAALAEKSFSSREHPQEALEAARLNPTNVDRSTTLANHGLPAARRHARARYL